MTRRAAVPEAELDVLVALRRGGPMTAADVVRTLRHGRPMTHGSAATLLGRLEAKGLVSRRKAEVGKAYVYSVTRRAESALRGAVDRIVDHLFGGDRIVLVASLLEGEPLETSEIERLEGLVADLARQGKRRGGSRP